jgi:hypothetical protein
MAATYDEEIARHSQGIDRQIHLRARLVAPVDGNFRDAVPPPLRHHQ